MITKKCARGRPAVHLNLEHLIGSFSQQSLCFHWLTSKGGVDVTPLASLANRFIKCYHQ